MLYFPRTPLLGTGSPVHHCCEVTVMFTKPWPVRVAERHGAVDTTFYHCPKPASDLPFELSILARLWAAPGERPGGS